MAAALFHSPESEFGSWPPALKALEGAEPEGCSVTVVEQLGRASSWKERTGVMLPDIRLAAIGHAPLEKSLSFSNWCVAARWRGAGRPLRGSAAGAGHGARRSRIHVAQME